MFLIIYLRLLLISLRGPLSREYCYYFVKNYTHMMSLAGQNFTYLIELKERTINFAVNCTKLVKFFHNDPRFDRYQLYEEVN